MINGTNLCVGVHSEVISKEVYKSITSIRHRHKSAQDLVPALCERRTDAPGRPQSCRATVDSPVSGLQVRITSNIIGPLLIESRLFYDDDHENFNILIYTDDLHRSSPFNKFENLL